MNIFHCASGLSLTHLVYRNKGPEKGSSEDAEQKNAEQKLQEKYPDVMKAIAGAPWKLTGETTTKIPGKFFKVRNLTKEQCGKYPFLKTACLSC